MTQKPTVSVVMATYNHAPFVGESIRSVLAQDFPDFELLISDDGSADETPRIVAEQTDPRIQFQANPRNRGAALVTNELIGRSRGRYVAVINSDDAWLPGKLTEQVEILDRDPAVGAVFGRVQFVDRDGEPIEKSALSFGEVFDRRNRSQGDWLRYFYARGNCLCHPTVLIRREIYDQVGLYDNRFRQLPDLDMWVRVVKHTGILVSTNDMIKFRIMPGENVSSDIYTNRVRTLNEHFFVALDFFNNVTPEILREGFGDLLKHPHLPTQAHVNIEAALLFCKPVPWMTQVYQIVALIKLRELLGDPSHRHVLDVDYDFDDRALHALEAEADGLQQAIPSTIELPTEDPSSKPRDISQVPTVELSQIILDRLMTRTKNRFGWR